MAVTPESVIQPEGELIEAMFPGYVIDTITQAWINQGITLAAALDSELQDQAVIAHVYARGYGLALTLVNSEAADTKHDSGKTQTKWEKWQLDIWRERQAHFQGVVDALLPSKYTGGVRSAQMTDLAGDFRPCLDRTVRRC